MTYVITQSCCADASCVTVCPVNCIHPTPEEREFSTSHMLYVDPSVCINCGACVTACPVNAIIAEYDVPEDSRQFIALNSVYYTEPGRQDYERRQTVPRRPRPRTDRGTVKVAIVGSGPSAMYTAEALFRSGTPVAVDVFERLPALGGLVRYGVAPDHQHTKQIALAFEQTARRAGCRVFLGVEIGADIDVGELTQSYHAVIHASGAAADRALTVPGEALDGSHSATDFVAWYNGHPDHVDDVYDLSDERAVVIGNGNVAMDVARVLLSGTDTLSRTDISDRALRVLKTSRVREVVVVGRRGPAQAALSLPELYGFEKFDDIDVIVQPAATELRNSAAVDAPGDGRRKAEEVLRIGSRPPRGNNRRLVLRFLASPVRILGDGHVDAVRLARTELVDDGRGSVTGQISDETDLLPCGLVFRAVGYRGVPVPDLPFDPTTGTVPNQQGRVLDPATSEPVPGRYVAGWIKRGPTGVIGTNKWCGEETARALLADFAAGQLPDPSRELAVPARAMTYDDWKALDRHEREDGRATGRPRIKATDWESMRRLALAADPIR